MGARSAGQLGVDEERRAAAPAAAARRAGPPPDLAELVDSRRDEEALEAEDSRRRAEGRARPRCPARLLPRSRRPRGPSRRRLRLRRRSASRVVVGGMLLSGMSTERRHAAGRRGARRGLEALPTPARPGSLTWTWVSTRPGMTTESPTSVTGTSPPATSAAPSLNTCAMHLPRMWRAARATPSGRTTRRLRRMKSAKLNRSRARW